MIEQNRTFREWKVCTIFSIQFSTPFFSMYKRIFKKIQFQQGKDFVLLKKGSKTNYLRQRFFTVIQIELLRYLWVKEWILVLETKLRSIFINVENETSPIINRISLVISFTPNRLGFESIRMYIEIDPISFMNESKDRSMGPRL